MGINATNYTKGSITGTNYTDSSITGVDYSKGSITGSNYTTGSIGIIEYGYLIRADSTSVTAGSTIVLANGVDTSVASHTNGKLSIKPTNWTES